MIQVTDADIAQAERLLLPVGAAFNEERRAFIRCTESRDVVACPGSGKTTALLAKILILASKMPFPDGSGVCVLTHTNVAIEQIKKKAGPAADILFNHPNYLGTIQSFVDRFLAIPLYRSEYHREHHSIDADLYLASVERLFNSTRKARFRLAFWRGDASSVGLLATSPDDLTVADALRKKFPKLRSNEEAFTEVVEIRKKLLDEGILSYRDAYALAVRYLNRFAQVVKAFRARFKYVFVDEMKGMKRRWSLMAGSLDMSMTCLLTEISRSAIFSMSFHLFSLVRYRNLH